MKVIIIEDERLTALDLKRTLLSVESTIDILHIINSIEEGKKYFLANGKPDLIFSDIRLGDGLSFELLHELHVPVIFCTAYDEYALNAFRANGIDYILKPFTKKSVEQALNKYKDLKGGSQEDLIKQYLSLDRFFFRERKTVSSILVSYKDIVKPIRIKDVAYFFLKNEVVNMFTFEGKTYFTNKSLDELEQGVGDYFYRANRQYLINRTAVSHVTSALSRKLTLHLTVSVPEILTISREKATSFMSWLQVE